MFIPLDLMFDRHIKQLIKLDLQDQHNALCHEYKNAKSLVEANGFYATLFVGSFHQGLFLRHVSMSLQIDSTFGIFVLGNGEDSWSM
jgi:hypothetical protein